MSLRHFKTITNEMAFGVLAFVPAYPGNSLSDNYTFLSLTSDYAPRIDIFLEKTRRIIVIIIIITTIISSSSTSSTCIRTAVGVAALAVIVTAVKSSHLGDLIIAVSL